MKIISIHSFRGGTGKSTISSNLASHIASLGNKVLLIDTDIRSPGVHALFGMHEESFTMTLNDYLSGDCDVDEIVYDVSKSLNLKRGKLFLVPSSIEYDMIATTLVSKHSHDLVKEAIDALVERFDLDFIIIDTHPGINEEVLITANLADVNIIVARPDNQDYQGLKVSTQIFHKMELDPLIILNKVHKKIEQKKLVANIEDLFEAPVVGVIEFSEDILMSESKHIFYKKNPKHTFSMQIKKIASELLLKNFKKK